MKNKKSFEKNKGTIIFLVVIVVLLVGVVVLSNALKKDYLEEITYDEYLEMVDGGKDFSVFFGEKNSSSYMKTLEIVKTSNINSYYVNVNNLSDDQRKDLTDEDSLFVVYEDKKEVYSYDDDFTSYQFISDLMDKEIIDKKFIEITISEYLNIIKEKGYHFMFIGSSQCGYCTMFKESINTAMKDNDFVAYYVDLANATDADRNKLYASDSYFSENEWGTPLNFLYKDGKRVDILNGYVEASELVSFLKNNKVIK